ncbi:unnamed protein product [Polarella glacialis]|uniref:Uncharacterized protein n=1 Tax=Polarella glacialis TaxID=89957 RepID=A0A813E4A6_POLGL|nr:unnamed protein product [Polarella glacialis]
MFTAPKRQKVAFTMEAGSVVDLPLSWSSSCISAGLGWDVSGAGDVEVDVFAVCLSKDCQMVGAVFFGNKEEVGLLHSGDNAKVTTRSSKQTSLIFLRRLIRWFSLLMSTPTALDLRRSATPTAASTTSRERSWLGTCSAKPRGSEASSLSGSFESPLRAAGASRPSGNSAPDRPGRIQCRTS